MNLSPCKLLCSTCSWSSSLVSCWCSRGSGMSSEARWKRETDSWSLFSVSLSELLVSGLLRNIIPLIGRLLSILNICEETKLLFFTVFRFWSFQVIVSEFLSLIFPKEKLIFSGKLASNNKQKTVLCNNELKMLLFESRLSSTRNFLLQNNWLSSSSLEQQIVQFQQIICCSLINWMKENQCLSIFWLELCINIFLDSSNSIIARKISQSFYMMTIINAYTFFGNKSGRSN